jgi:hypothetical protein
MRTFFWETDWMKVVNRRFKFYRVQSECLCSVLKNDGGKSLFFQKIWVYGSSLKSKRLSKSYMISLFDSHFGFKEQPDMRRIRMRREFVDELWQVSWTFSHHSVNFWPWANPEITTISCWNVKRSLNLPSWETHVILSTQDPKRTRFHQSRPLSYLVTSLNNFFLSDPSLITRACTVRAFSNLFSVSWTGMAQNRQKWRVRPRESGKNRGVMKFNHRKKTFSWNRGGMHTITCHHRVWEVWFWVICEKSNRRLRWYIAFYIIDQGHHLNKDQHSMPEFCLLLPIWAGSCRKGRETLKPDQVRRESPSRELALSRQRPKIEGRLFSAGSQGRDKFTRAHWDNCAAWTDRWTAYQNN